MRVMLRVRHQLVMIVALASVGAILNQTPTSAAWECWQYPSSSFCCEEVLDDCDWQCYTTYTLCHELCEGDPTCQGECWDGLTSCQGACSDQYSTCEDYEAPRPGPGQ